MNSFEISLFVILTCQLLVPLYGRRGSGSSVTTSIDAKWNQGPLVLEIAEFLYDENNVFFWSFIDSINDINTPLSELGTEKEKYDICIEKASNFLSAVNLNLLKLSLSLHIHSPRIEMYNQMSSQRNIPCNPYIDVLGISVCSLLELESVLQNPPKGVSELFRMDHHYPGSANRSVCAILYGEIGTKEFASFHNVLRQKAIDGHIDYVIRHYVQNKLPRRVKLSGYGVELQMKSTEYKAQDDSVVRPSDEKSSEEEEDNVVEGFDFKKLKELYPDKKKQLNDLRSHLMESSEELVPLKVWQFQELGLQAAQLIMNTPIENALTVFIQIAQNFPMQTKSLVNIRIKPEIQKEIDKNQEQFLISLNVQSSEAVLFINGMYFEIDLTDMMTILEVIRNELHVMEGIHKIGVKEKSAVKSLLSLDLSESTNHDFAIDIRDSAIMWVNDIETDSKYKRWSPQLIELLKPTFPGMLRSIRRNFFNLVIICDPADQNSWSLLKMAESFLVYNAPLRVGLVFSTPPIQVSGLESASVALLNAYNYVNENDDKYQGLSFITEVYAAIKSERDVEVEDVKKRLKAKYYSIDLTDVLGRNSDHNTGRQLAADFIQRSGIGNLPQVLVNGVPLDEKSLTKSDFELAMLGYPGFAREIIGGAYFGRGLYPQYTH